jgi:calmodulin
LLDEVINVFVEIREAFSLFDKTGDGTIPTGSISELLRALCQNPTEAEIREILNGLPAGKYKSYS